MPLVLPSRRFLIVGAAPLILKGETEMNKPVRIQRKRKPPESDRLPDYRRRSYIDSLDEAGLPIDDMTDEELEAELERIVYVGRPTKWGNPWPTVEMYRWWLVHDHFEIKLRAGDYQEWWNKHNHGFILAPHDGSTPIKLDWILSHLGELRGKNLACWCPLDQPCHVGVLLEMANAEQEDD